MKRIYIILILWLLLCTAVAAVRQSHKEIARLRNNQTALMSDVKHYRTADSLNAARAKSLTLTIGELKANNSQLADEVKSMGVKLKHLQSVSGVQQVTKYVFQVDTVIVADTLQRYEYHDEWLDFTMTDGKVGIETRDSLVIVRYQKQRRFLFFTWAKRTPEIAVENRNPNATIIGISEISVMKK